MKKILVLTLILNIGFCSELPLNANVDCHQLRMSFSGTGVTTISESFECPEGLEIKTDGYTVSNGTGNVVNNYGCTVNVINNYGTVTPDVKVPGTPAQVKK